MTDNEIIKAFTICANQGACKDCPLDDLGGVERCMHTLLLNALDLINRQQAEIAELKEKNSGLALGLLYEVVNEDEQLRNEITKVAKSEAYKEFANRLLRKATLIRNDLGTEGFVTIDDIYETLKEME